MFPFSFANAALLGGLLALGVPILIHLLLKQKKKRLRFSTLQFFLKRDEQSTQKRTLRNLLLLAMRLLLFALLVFAFARPYFPEAQTPGGGQKRRDVVFVLDRSASMQATGVDGMRWGAAKETIRKILSELKADDRAALIGCAAHTDVISPFAPATVVSKVLSDLQPTAGASDIAAGLQQAVRLFDFDDRSRTPTIYVVSDLQRSSIKDLVSHPLPQEAEVKVLNVGDLFTPNIALTDLLLEGEIVSRPRAVVANYSEEESNGLKATCLI
ncbi:MAG: VWA domain-containing protein, partial [Verrucomicrobia bacterium]|nr:VWA domain-containing protein [Verrucomicrobiota bacterium]